MIRDTDFNWQFWRKCYCALDRELHHLLEFHPTVKDGHFSLMVILNLTNHKNSHVIEEKIFHKTYQLETVKLDLKNEWEKWAEMFMNDYFLAKEKGCKR
jgi:hypothetical protein